jgi:hypothetical protein
MKPLSHVQITRRDANRRFPIIDCNYSSLGLGEFKTRCARTPRLSFTEISCNYFNSEARRDFVTEAFVFALVIAATVPALLDCGRALIAFLRAVGGL